MCLIEVFPKTYKKFISRLLQVKLLKSDGISLIGTMALLLKNVRILCAQYLVYLFVTSLDVKLATKFIHRDYIA